MFEKHVAESTAFAIERRNFDYLPDDQATRWRREFLTARSKKIPPPRKLIVELLNTCNLDCPICRVGQHGIDLSRRMPMSVFEYLLDEVRGIGVVRLNGLGESTLLPDFSGYVSILRDRKIGIELITNGSGKLSDYESVYAARGHVLISWDAAQPHIFERVRYPARWPEYFEHLKQLSEAANLSASGRCSLLFTQQKGNVGEIRGVVDVAAELRISSVQINVAKMSKLDWAKQQLALITADINTASTVAKQRGVTLFVPDQICGFTLQESSSHPTAATGCSAPWEEVAVRWNGDVQACNMFNPFLYGNIHRTRFLDIWSGIFAAVFRNKLNGEDRHPYCEACAYIPRAYK